MLYLLIAGPNGGEDDLGGSGIPARLYFMVGLAAFGTMNGVVAGGARIAAERSVGWTRQLRITPLRPSAYIATKLVTAYVFALLTLAVLYAAGIALGVRMPRARVDRDDRRCCCSACCRSRRSASRSATC